MCVSRDDIYVHKLCDVTQDGKAQIVTNVYQNEININISGLSGVIYIKKRAFPKFICYQGPSEDAARTVIQVIYLGSPDPMHTIVILQPSSFSQADERGGLTLKLLSNEKMDIKYFFSTLYFVL